MIASFDCALKHYLNLYDQEKSTSECPPKLQALLHIYALNCCDSVGLVRHQGRHRQRATGYLFQPRYIVNLVDCVDWYFLYTCQPKMLHLLPPSLQANSDSLVYSIEAGKPISLEKRDNYILPSPQSALGPSRPSPNLMRYLNATSSKGPLDDLRKQMLVSRGKLLVEMVESLSGKPVPGKVRERKCLPVFVVVNSKNHKLGPAGFPLQC